MKIRLPHDVASSRSHRVLAALAVAIALGATSPAATNLAAQGPTGAIYQLTVGHSGKCLSVSGASLDDAAAVVQWTCTGEAHQQWSVEPTGDGYFRLLARHSGKALDVSRVSLDNAAPVIQYRPNGGENQQWALVPMTGGAYVLVARHSGKALDVSRASVDDGAEIIQWTRHDGANQQWTLTASGPPPPVDEGPSSADTVRFLEQSTWGPTPALVAHVRDIGFEAFLNEQFDAPISGYPSRALYPTTRDTTACPNGSTCQRDNYTMYPLQTRFFERALYGEDQLRQRVAFALHQILVVSGVDITQSAWMTPYLQLLDRQAFGDYRQLLIDLTLNPAMGNYLDVNGNSRTRPNENYAREILQLFSIGTVRLNPDGTPQVDGNGVAIPTYTQETVNNFARVFTGWRFATAPAPGVPNYLDPMVANEAQHDINAKTLLNGDVLPARQSARADLEAAIDNIVNDPNAGPFISKQLIQHLVTSNPSFAYVARVAAVFNGSQGRRGDLRAVIRAILLDAEARGDVKLDPAYGRLRHPAQFIAGVLRAFNARSADGTSTSDGYLNPQSVSAGMDVFRPPSVFSYFSPSAVVPGTGGLRGPEFAIYSTSTALARANFVNTMVFGRINVSANAPRGTSLDLAPLTALASSPDAMVALLNDQLLHGTMTGEMKSSVAGAVRAVAATNALKRARTAAYLVLSSPQYQVQR